MTDSSYTSQEQTMVDEQVERFMAAFSDLRKVMGAGFKQGFSPTQFMVMGLVESVQEGEPYTISSIATKLGIDPATVVRTVDSLEKRELVERRRDRQDRRQVFVELTNAGCAARREIRQCFKRHIQAILVGMSAEGRAAFLNGLEEFVQVGQEVHTKRMQEPEKPTTHP